MNVKLPDDQTLWFRNLPLKESEEGPEQGQAQAGKEPEIELFIEPLTGLAIPMPNQHKDGRGESNKNYLDAYQLELPPVKRGQVLRTLNQILCMRAIRQIVCKRN